jgi:hypothetical protein
MLVERNAIFPINAPIRARALISTLQLHLPLPMEPVPVAARQNYAHGRINHVVVEEVQEASDVARGMSFINATSAVVLFNSGASHSFISATYIEKHNLSIDLLKCQMIVSSLGGDMPTGQLCPKVNLKIRG